MDLNGVSNQGIAYSYPQPTPKTGGPSPWSNLDEHRWSILDERQHSGRSEEDLGAAMPLHRPPNALAMGEATEAGV
jgi:hypothetical protein